MACSFRWKALVSKNKGDKVPLKDDDKDIVEKLQAKLAKANAQRESAKKDEQKLAAAAAVEVAKADLKQVRSCICRNCSTLHHNVLIGPKTAIGRETYVQEHPIRIVTRVKNRKVDSRYPKARG